MSAAPDPGEAAVPPGAPEIPEAAQLARERLHEEIERVRQGVEEMLDRRELEKLRIETRDYLKKRVRRSEKRLERSVRELDERFDELEERVDRVRAEREEAEWRLHNNTEQMLDGLLDTVRLIADWLARQPVAR
jgi:DNA repair exonuclease SbcCD ATPase subunit